MPENCERDRYLMREFQHPIHQHKFAKVMIQNMLFRSFLYARITKGRASPSCHARLILVRFGLLSCTFWERAAHSVDHMFSLYFDYLLF